MKYSSWKLHPNKSIRFASCFCSSNSEFKVSALEICKSTLYTCGVLSDVEFVGYYFMIIFENSLAKVDQSGSNFLPFSILRAIITQSSLHFGRIA